MASVDFLKLLNFKAGMSVPTYAKTLAETEQFIAGYGCFGENIRERGGREWRGIRHQRYTYVHDLKWTMAFI